MRPSIGIDIPGWCLGVFLQRGGCVLLQIISRSEVAPTTYSFSGGADFGRHGAILHD
jgi:hypothetical protein